MGDHTILRVRLTPRAGRAAAQGITDHDGPALRIRVAAPPVEGAANKALIAFLAGNLTMPKSGISIVSGEKSRIKHLRLDGTGVARRLQAAFAPLRPAECDPS